jgi:hypothetical protein
MNNNQLRITLITGAAAGELLAFALLPMAVAFADPTPDVFGLEPLGPITSTEATLGVPPLYEQYTGEELFGVADTSGVVGSQFEASTSQLTTSFGFDNEQIQVLATEITAPASPPPGDGSVYDIASFDNGLITNDYADLVTGTGSTATQTVTDTLNLFGTAIDLTPLFSGIDASPIDLASLF